MALNESQVNGLKLSQEALNDLVPKFVLYIVQGHATFILSFIIFVTISVTEILREKKEYVLIGALAFTDSLTGLGLILAGYGRIRLIYTKQANNLVTSLGCLMTPWNICWVITDHMQAALLALISLDRLIMVCSPLRYIGYGRRYAYILLIIFHLPYVFMITGLVYELYTDQQLVVDKPSLCFTAWVYSMSYYHIVTTQKAIFTALSIVLYFGVWYKYQKSQAAVAPTLARTALSVEKKKQKRFTVTLGISCLFTFMFVVVPLLLRNAFAFVNSSNAFMSAFLPVLGLIEYFNPIVNFFLYIKRHRDIRLAVFSVNS